MAGFTLLSTNSLTRPPLYFPSSTRAVYVGIIMPRSVDFRRIMRSDMHDSLRYTTSLSVTPDTRANSTALTINFKWLKMSNTS